MYTRGTNEGREVITEDNFGTNTKTSMHYSWLQHHKRRSRVWAGHTRTKQDAVGVRGDDAVGRCRDWEEGFEDGWHSPMVQTCSGSALRTKRYIYIFCVLPHLESTPLGRVEHQEAFEEVLAVCGHVERDAVLPSEHTLPQFLQRRMNGLISDHC